MRHLPAALHRRKLLWARGQAVLRDPLPRLARLPLRRMQQAHFRSLHHGHVPQVPSGTFCMFVLLEAAQQGHLQGARGEALLPRVLRSPLWIEASKVVFFTAACFCSFILTEGLFERSILQWLQTGKSACHSERKLNWTCKYGPKPYGAIIVLIYLPVDDFVHFEIIVWTCVWEQTDRNQYFKTVLSKLLAPLTKVWRKFIGLQIHRIAHQNVYIAIGYSRNKFFNIGPGCVTCWSTVGYSFGHTRKWWLQCTTYTFTNIFNEHIQMIALSFR